MRSSGASIALVTGGSLGLGRNIALKLAEQGTDIILTCESDERSAREVVKRVQDKGGNDWVTGQRIEVSGGTLL